MEASHTLVAVRPPTTPYSLRDYRGLGESAVYMGGRGHATDHLVVDALRVLLGLLC